MKENNSKTLCRAFIANAKEVLSGHQGIKHSWTIDDGEGHCILDIHKLSNNGFNVKVEVFPNEIIVSADGPHHHFDDTKNIETTVQNALGLVRDLLSTSMRVVEFCSNGKPYRWDLESIHNGQWQREETTGILIYNFFGKKTKNIYQNHLLPSRM